MKKKNKRPGIVTLFPVAPCVRVCLSLRGVCVGKPRNDMEFLLADVAKGFVIEAKGRLRGKCRAIMHELKSVKRRR